MSYRAENSTFPTPFPFWQSPRMRRAPFRTRMAPGWRYSPSTVTGSM